ncbi:hypothetical protein AB0U54_11665, partial [Escherichia coli]
DKLDIFFAGDLFKYESVCIAATPQDELSKIAHHD